MSNLADTTIYAYIGFPAFLGTSIIFHVYQETCSKNKRKIEPAQISIVYNIKNNFITPQYPPVQVLRYSWMD